MSRKPKKSNLSEKLLAWYDVHRRVLPWRAAKGKRADPYRVWLSEIMLQQTTVQAVGKYYRKFLTLWPDVAALAGAEQAMRTYWGSVRRPRDTSVSISRIDVSTPGNPGAQSQIGSRSFSSRR